MITSVYSIYDSKAKAYSLPFHAVNDAVATRMVGASVNDPGTTLNKHPEDFIIYELARFDDEKGTFETVMQRAVSPCIALKETTNHDEN